MNCEFERNENGLVFVDSGKGDQGAKTGEPEVRFQSESCKESCKGDRLLFSLPS